MSYCNKGVSGIDHTGVYTCKRETGDKISIGNLSIQSHYVGAPKAIGRESVYDWQLPPPPLCGDGVGVGKGCITTKCYFCLFFFSD